MLAAATPLQNTLAVVGVFLLALLWVYIAARLGALGVARSLWEFRNKFKSRNRGGTTMAENDKRRKPVREPRHPTDERKPADKPGEGREPTGDRKPDERPAEKPADRPGDDGSARR